MEPASTNPKQVASDNQTSEPQNTEHKDVQANGNSHSDLIQFTALNQNTVNQEKNNNFNLLDFNEGKQPVKPQCEYSINENRVASTNDDLLDFSDLNLNKPNG